MSTSQDILTIIKIYNINQKRFLKSHHDLETHSKTFSVFDLHHKKLQVERSIANAISTDLAAFLSTPVPFKIFSLYLPAPS